MIWSIQSPHREQEALVLLEATLFLDELQDPFLFVQASVCGGAVLALLACLGFPPMLFRLRVAPSGV